jgi:prolyl oligopeptidase PreP (S9A serine peptidase family)
MTKLLFTILISVFSLSCFGQTNDSLSISYWTPPSWFSGNKKLLHDNLENYKFSNEQMNRLVNDINTSTVLGIYYKYDPKIHSGLVPTIKFYLRHNNIKDFEKFFVSVTNEIESIKSQVLNFRYIDTPKTILVGQRKAFYASSTYNLNTQTGEVANVRTKFVCIPINKKYLYVTLIDNDKEDCSNLFAEVINKIKTE